MGTTRKNPLVTT